MSVENPTIAEIGEAEALRRTVSRLNQSEFAVVGSGDDCAVVSTTDERFVVTTDTMIEGHDFRLDWSSAYDLGWKAVASNLADVAAMGARPTALVVALAVPSTTRVNWLEQFADGLREACQQLAPGVGVVGGDLAAADTVFIAVTAHGQLEGREPVLRSGAKPGDVLAVAGTLGRAACGLALLQSGEATAISAYDDWVNTQRRPNPPIAAGAEAARAGASSMLDLSDGLAKDAHRVAKASGVTMQIDRRALDGYLAMLEEPAMRIQANPLLWVLAGGEDHSLLATFSPNATIPRSFKPIGRVLEQGSNLVLLDDTPLEDAGWDSFTV